MKWQYCVLTAIETTKQADFVIAYDDGPKNIKAKSRLKVFKTLGLEGWEMVGINTLQPGINEFYFKRPI